MFASLPGAGPALVPRLLVAFGTRRALQMQCYGGIAPIKEASGKTKWVHFRFACPKFLRQTFHEFAGHSIRQCEWARAYYQHKRAEEKKCTMRRFARSPTNGFASFFDAGRRVSPTTSRCTCSPCAAGDLSSVLCRQPLVLSGDQLPVSKNFLENSA